MDDNSNRIEYLTQIIEDLYINYRIKTLDNYMNRTGKLKEISDIIYTKERIEKKMIVLLKEKIGNRLKELYDEHKHVTNTNWIKETNGLSQKERIRKCNILIEELESLLNS